MLPQVALNVFDTRSGKKLRIFAGNMEDYAIGSSAGPGGALRWPIFKCVACCCSYHGCVLLVCGVCF